MWPRIVSVAVETQWYVAKVESRRLVRANCHNLGNPWKTLNPPDKLQTWPPKNPRLTFIE